MSYCHIMLIDDDQDDQEIFIMAMHEILSKAECTVRGSAEEALLDLKAGKVVPDLIFLDLNMPIMSGQQFLMEIKNYSGLKEIPVIILSTSSRVETILEAKRLGAHDFITKPDKFDALKSILHSILL